MKFILRIDDEVLIEDILVKLVSISKRDATLEITRIERQPQHDNTNEDNKQ